MTQQINLLHGAGAGRRGAMYWLVAMLLVSVLVQLVWAAVLQWRVDGLRDQREQIRSQTTSMTEALSKRRAQLGQSDGAQWQGRLAQLQTQLDSMAAWGDWQAAGDLGRLEGFSPILALLGGTKEEGVWLQAVHVRSGAQSLEIQGKALNAAAVLRYQSQLNLQLPELGYRVPQVDVGDAASPREGAPISRVLDFRLF